MLKVWLTRKWLITTAVVLLAGVVCYWLGQWQWSRYEEKRAKVSAVTNNYSAPPRPLADAWPPGPVPVADQWTRVTATGTYAADTQLLVRNRPYDGVYGFEVLVPFTSEGRTVLVDRGWVPNAQTATQVPVVTPPVSGEVTITGWIKPEEESLGRDLPRGQVASINVADARSVLPSLDSAPAYVVLGTEAPADSGRANTPRLLPAPQESLGVNQAYAIQWWITAPGLALFVFLALRREVRAEQTPRAAAPRPAKPKKIRIWDEEDG